MTDLGRKRFLFSVDLEDVRDLVTDGYQHEEAVVEPTMRYLDYLKRNNMHATFFVVGMTADNFPDLVREIIKGGHEIACHTYSHVHITKLTPDEFKRDIERALNSLARLGADNVIGFRAPTFSLVESTRWVYAALKELGFKYSSSVLPSHNPLFGWKDFGGEQYMDGIYEIPMNIGYFPFLVPFGGGTYFRCIPHVMLKTLFANSARKNETILGYFHPYDVHVSNNHFMHPQLGDNKVLNRLMYINRSQVFKRLDVIIKNGFKILRYDEYLQAKLNDPGFSKRTEHIIAVPAR